MNRMSLLFATLLAASFAMTPGNAPESSQAPERNHAIPSRGGPARKTTDAKKKEPVLPDEEAKNFIAGFMNKGSVYANTGAAYQVLFATVSDPVQTHLAAVFDHDVAALQDGAQDSGYLFDSSWIPWEIPQSYDTFEDEVNAEQLRRLKHDLPGILLFRDAQPGDNPYARGLIVFLLAEKPTAGINITQATNALKVFASATAGATAAGAPNASLSWTDPVRIAGPTFSGSFNSLAPLVNAFTNAPGIPAPKRFLIRSGGFTSCSAALTIVQSIAQKFNVQVDLGSASHPFESWNELALRRLKDSGIDRGKVAVLSEGESLFGESVSEEAAKQDPPSDKCRPEYTQELKPAPPLPWNLQFPRDISALRSSYEKQGLFDQPTNPETGKRSLHLGSEEARNGDSIRMFGTDETVASQESVLFGISEFIRSHGIRAVIIVATSEEDSFFLTRFLHANNAGVRVVIFGATRLFMRGSTAQFRGDMMVSGFPLLPRLHDWTNIKGAGQDQAYHVFPNDSSEGAYMAVRDLLYRPGIATIPHEFSRPDWRTCNPVDLRPRVYIAALGGGATWPISELDDARGFTESASATTQKNKAPGVEPSSWRLSMPFEYGTHLGSDNKPHSIPNAGQMHPAAPDIHPARFWQLAYWICIAIPVIFCFGIGYADPLRRRKFAYLQPAAHWSQWILLVTIPALLSEVSFLVLARQMIFPPGLSGDHKLWLECALIASLALPFAMIGISFVKALYAGCFAKCKSCLWLTPALLVFIGSALFVFTVFFAFLASNQSEVITLPEVLHTYREMHWDSGLSLLPPVLLMILAIAVWNYEALVGISVLHTRPDLPCFPQLDHISEPEAENIVRAGHPFPVGPGAGMYWISVAIAGVCIALALSLWPSFRAITTFSKLTVTHRVLELASVALLFMLMDIFQFVWLWAELRDMLQVLNAQPFKRSFLTLRNFNWNSIWSFSGGSFQERRKVLAAELACAFDIIRHSPGVLEKWEFTRLRKLRRRYRKMVNRVHLDRYRQDLKFTHECLAKIGTAIAQSYQRMLATVQPPPCASALPTTDNPFCDEQRELEQLPPWLCLHERFLCLLYLGFIHIIIARLRTLAISMVLMFSLIGLAMAVYPFQPSQPLFITGACALAAIAIVMFVVFSQMDRDPILARILQSNPNKLEWSFYGKFIDALALPVLTLLSTLLPGGAGRLIDLLRTAFSHAQ